MSKETSDTVKNNYAQLTGVGAPWELDQETINGIDYKCYKNAPKNLVELLDAGRAHGDNEFLVYKDERISFNEFFARVDGLAQQLQSHYNVGKGHRVALSMRNYPEWMIGFAAVVYAGGTIVPLNSWGKRDELMYGLNDSGAEILLCDEQRYDYIADDLANINVKAIVARAKGPLNNEATRFADLVEAGYGKKPKDFALQSDDIAMIMYTSGTTGNPKGAVSQHRNICQAIYNFEAAAIASAMSDPEPIGKMLERGYPPKVLLAVPLFHVSGCHSVFLLSLRAGRPIVIMYKWGVKEALELIENERITMISAVPAMLIGMLDSPEWSKHDTTSLFGFGAGGAAQPPGLGKKIDSKLPDSFPGTGYGLTETNASGFAVTGAAYRAQPTTAGLATPVVEVKIINEAGESLPQGEHGEICLKSPGNIQGYWNKPQATEETIQDGWVHTGDIGFLDENGFLFITDRIKDMVIRGGENIYSVEVESAILDHPSVLDAAAFGLPDDKLGEELAIAIVLKEGQTLSEEQVQAHIGETLAAFKVPRFVYFEDELPKNATMKVLKKQLRAKYL